MALKILTPIEKIQGEDQRIIQPVGDSDGIIASFYDLSGNSSFFISGSSTNLGYVGIKTTTPNEVLTVVGNISASEFIRQKPNMSVLALTANQSLSATTDTILNLTVKNDPNSWFVSANKSVKPTSAGYYNVIAMVTFDTASNANNQQNIQILKNSDSQALAMTTNNTGQPQTMVAQATVYCDGSSDEIKLQAYTGHNSGQTIRGTTDGNWTKLEVIKIS